MTVKEIKNMYDGKYAAVEVYKGNADHFHTDNCRYTEEYTDDDKVVISALMDKMEYASTLLANSCEDVNEYWDCSGLCETDKVLCIMIK